jgi:hypothetical protein
MKFVNFCHRHPNQLNANVVLCSLMALLLLMSFLTIYKPATITALKIGNPTEEEKNEWVAQFWNWRVAQPPVENGGCIMNDRGIVVMLMETAQESQMTRNPIEQNCTILANQSIMIPLWVAWCDTAIPEHREFRGERLAQCAREEYNLGHIQSSVKVDGLPVARLDVMMKMPPGTPEYIAPPVNVTEFSSEQFNIFIPPTTSKGEQGSGNFPAGSHGWWVFLDPLPPGEHTISYNTRVDPVTADVTVLGAENITYSLQVT